MFTFIDLFSGIGGFRNALVSKGGVCIGFSEVDKNAIKTYCDNSNGEYELNFGDITKIESLPHSDILTAGVPCQSWSVAGKMLGFADDRGQLWNDTLYLLNQSQPKAFIFENVRGLYDPRNEKELNYILSRINESGYHCQVFLIDSSEYGVCQFRERVFIIGFKNPEFNAKFKLGEKKPRTVVGDVIDLPDAPFDFFKFSDLRKGPNVIHSWEMIPTTFNQKKICEALLNNRRKSKYGPKDGNPLSFDDLKALYEPMSMEDMNYLIEQRIIEPVGDKYDFVNKRIYLGINGVHRVYSRRGLYPTLVASDACDYVLTKDIESKEDMINNIGAWRKITKEEACLIQGFPQNMILPEERTKWMKQIGNSVTVPVIDMLIEQVCKTGVFNNNI